MAARRFNGGIFHITGFYMIICKKSGKPFKNGLKLALVVGETVNPYSKKPAYILEDGSVVDKYICIVY